MAGKFYAFYTQGFGGTQKTWSVQVDADALTNSTPIQIPGTVGNLQLYFTSCYFGAWSTEPVIFPIINSGGFDLANASAGTLQIGIVSGFGASSGAWPHCDPDDTQYIVAYGHEGSEPPDPFGRPGLSFYTYLNNARTVTAPVWTAGNGTVFDFIYSLARSPYAPDAVYAFCAPQANSNVDEQAALVRFNNQGILTGANIIDTALVNGTVAGAGDNLRSNPGVLSPDGTVFIYYHVGDQPLPADFPDVHWFNKVDTTSLAVTLSSPTPGAVAAPDPWGAPTLGNGMPVGPWVMAVSRNGKYVFARFPVSGGLNPYALWDTEANQIHYGDMSDIAGFNPALFFMGGLEFYCFDDQDNLCGLFDVGATTSGALIRFSISGVTLSVDASLDFSTFDGGSSSIIGLMYVPGSTAVEQTPPANVVIGMPAPHYAYRDKSLAPKQR